jgi:hypothetical protein
MDVVSWLTGATAWPSTAYLASISISLPLIGLTQLVQYLVVCRVSGLTPGDLRGHIGGATGRSQGVVSAVAIAASTTFESFTHNARKAVRWLFFCGLCTQEAFPVLSLEPSVVDGLVQGGEGVPSPMLAVTGLALEDLEPHNKETNIHLPANSQLPRVFGQWPASIRYDGSGSCTIWTCYEFEESFWSLTHHTTRKRDREALCGGFGTVGCYGVRPQCTARRSVSIVALSYSPLTCCFPGSDMRNLKISITHSLCVQIFLCPNFHVVY